jgi:endonuclease G, mitochondrial
MAHFPQGRIDEIAKAVLNKIGYELDVRSILLAPMLPEYKYRLIKTSRDIYQIRLDLQDLNDTDRLIDGTLPFQLWLEQASQLLMPYPAESKIIQTALDDLSKKMLKAEPVEQPTLPVSRTMDKIVQEKILFKNSMLPYAFLQGGVTAGLSVGRMKVSRYDGGQISKRPDGEPVRYLGTGWLLTKDLIITNHHVINARSDGEQDASEHDLLLQASASSIQFDFDQENLEGKTFPVSNMEDYNKQLDFAILRLKTAADRLPLRLENRRVNVDKEKPQVVNIIQHPNGGSKKVALRNNHIYEEHYPKVHYFTDTEYGTSGSPVFNDQWAVVALHRASKFIKETNYQGMETSWINEGVQLAAIFEYLENNKPELVKEIRNSNESVRSPQLSGALSG